MRKVIKRMCLITAMAFTVVMILSGCGQTDKIEPKGETTNGSSTVIASTAPQEPSLAPVELSWYLYSKEPKDLQMVEGKINEYLKDKINATIKIYPIDPSDTFKTKTSAMSAANEPYDICFTALWLEFQNSAARNRWLPLNLQSNNLIDKYAPKIKEILGEDAMKAGQINGVQFAIPVLKEKALSYGMIFNKALVDKYNIDISTINKMSDLEPYFKLIKEKEPTITPYGPYQDSTNAFGDKLTIFECVSGDALVPADIRNSDSDFKVINHFETPEYKESCEIARKWYQAGYIDKDAAADSNTYWQKYNEGLYFALNSTLKPGDAEAWSTEKVKWVQKLMLTPYISANTLGGAMNAISMTSQNPERALMFLEMLYTDPYLVNLVSYGIEGQHYTKLSDNTIDNLKADVGYSINRWEIGNNFLQYLQKQEDPNKWKNFDEFNISAIIYKTFGFNFDVTPFRTEYAGIKNVVSEMSKGLEFGAVDPAADLPRFIDKLKAAGNDKVIEAIQKSLDDWLKAQGK